jgi:hypothetical protein
MQKLLRSMYALRGVNSNNLVHVLNYSAATVSFLRRIS